MNIKSNNIFLFPIDTVSRELEWQLFLALEFKRLYNSRSIIAHKYLLKRIHSSSKNCFWFGRLPSNNGATDSDLKLLLKGNANNTKFLFLHDEGAFFPMSNYVGDVLKTHPIQTANKANNFKFLLWGEEQKQIIDEKAKDNGIYINTEVVGMPRFDLFKKEFDWWDLNEVQNLKLIHGDFILIITKFGYANSNEHRSGIINPTFLKANKIIESKSSVKDFFKRWEKDNYDFASYIVMLQELFEVYPNKKFIIRPHPSEDSIFYKDVFRNSSNVKIIREGDVRPWIKASEALIHSGCTTGLEAYLADKFVINYIPHKPTVFDIEIAKEAGIYADSSERVIELVSKVLNSFKTSFSNSSKSKLYNIESSSILKTLEVVKNEISNSNLASARIDNYFIRKFIWLENLTKDRRNAKNKGMSNRDFGRKIRLSDLPMDLIHQKIYCYNEKYKTKIEPHLIENNIVVI